MAKNSSKRFHPAAGVALSVPLLAGGLAAHFEAPASAHDRGWEAQCVSTHGGTETQGTESVTLNVAPSAAPATGGAVIASSATPPEAAVPTGPTAGPSVPPSPAPSSSPPPSPLPSLTPSPLAPDPAPVPTPVVTSVPVANQPQPTVSLVSGRYGIVLTPETHNGGLISADTYLLTAGGRRIKQVGHAEVISGVNVTGFQSDASSPFPFELSVNGSDTGRRSATLQQAGLFSGDALSDMEFVCRFYNR